MAETIALTQVEKEQAQAGVNSFAFVWFDLFHSLRRFVWCRTNGQSFWTRVCHSIVIGDTTRVQHPEYAYGSRDAIHDAGGRWLLPLVKKAFGPFVGFMGGWMNWVVSWVDVSIYPVWAATYLGFFIPALNVGATIGWSVCFWSSCYL